MNENTKRLLEGAENGDKNEIERLLNEPEYNDGGYGQAAMLEAAKKGQLEVIEKVFWKRDELNFCTLSLT